MAPKTGKVDMHERAVATSTVMLRKLGLTVHMMPRTNSPFDLLVGGAAKVEIKIAEAWQLQRNTDSKIWLFNIHRHGKMAARGLVDFYVFYLPPISELGFKYGLTLVVPAAEVDTPTVRISPRTLMVKWGRFYSRWQDIKNFCKNGAK